MTALPLVHRTHPDEPPRPLTAQATIAALRAAAVTHVVIVPDTVQKAFLSALGTQSHVKTVFACTEDEAIGINAGLYATGHRPILSIQNNGLYACINTIRGIAHDASVPTVMLIGQYGQKAQIMPEDSPLRMVRMLEPTLTTWKVPFKWLWSERDLDTVPQVYERARQNRGPAALLIPIPMEG